MVNYILLNISLFILYCYMFKKVRHGLHMLQLEYYKNDRYLNWKRKNSKQCFSYRDLVLILIPLICMFNLKTGLILLMFFSILLYISRNIYIEKKKMVVTGRIKRMYITETVIYLIFVILINFSFWFLLGVGILIIFAYFIPIIINTVNIPLEKAIQNRFVRKAKNKLKEKKDMIIIGVTGSYGKTSTKYILSTILNQKYNVLKTPASFNTKMGIVRTINEYLKPTDQVFVCEMGADQVGEIKELCNLVHPDYGMITSIGPQHLETFGSLENIKRTKFELVDSLPETGVAFLNYDDENIKSMGTSKNKVTYGIKKENDYYATDIQINEFGSEFVIHTKSKEEIRVKTKILGEHNIVNIIGAVAISKELGLTNEQIQLGIKLIKPVEHRLEIKKHSNGTIIIDDAYNSNIKGAEVAVNVLGRFLGRKRILVTPGIVELGEKMYEYNKRFGKQAANNCDFAILVGKKQAEPINDGLLEAGYDKNKIFIAENFESAMKKMNELVDSNTVILLENDLSDNYL